MAAPTYAIGDLVMVDDSPYYFAGYTAGSFESSTADDFVLALSPTEEWTSQTGFVYALQAAVTSRTAWLTARQTALEAELIEVEAELTP